ncbi:DUF2971 domain-containing protein [Aeromonas caviae]|uniref:DUF2971 domain-containing protein n=1 Tax=Aeromonas caviae TaxID=648 RepID=UPI0038D0021C
MSLYKFHAFNDNSISALEAYSAWFSKPALFNDPFEGLYKEIMIPLNEELYAELISYMFHDNEETKSVILSPSFMKKEWLMGKMIEFCKGIVRAQQSNFYESGLCCFINDEKVTPYEEPLMWGHYGDGLKGFVIQFESDAMDIFEDEKIGAINVRYESEPPVLDCYRLAISALRKHNEEYDIAINDILQIITTKSKWWEYEDEVRFISYKNGNKLFKYRDGSIKSIIIGSKMSGWQKRTIKAIAEKHQISVIKEAVTSDDSYKVCLRDLSV